MNLREYLRAEWSQYIRPLIIKDKCEFCGSEEDLHLHHIDKFYNLLMETLEELQLQELDTEDYTKEELNLISHLMLSKQIRSKYKTLCKKCHFKIHNIEKFEEEYKRHYYNPNGSYIILDIDKLKELKIDNNILPRYIYLCCYSNYGNKLTIVTSKTRHKTILKDDLFNIFTMGRMEVYRTLKELTDNELIQIEDETILTWAIKNNRGFRYDYNYSVDVKVIDALLEAGADYNAENSDGKNALMVAASKGREDIIELLEKYGA